MSAVTAATFKLYLTANGSARTTTLNRTDSRILFSSMDHTSLPDSHPIQGLDEARMKYRNPTSPPLFVRAECSHNKPTVSVLLASSDGTCPDAASEPVVTRRTWASNQYFYTLDADTERIIVARGQKGAPWSWRGSTIHGGRYHCWNGDRMSRQTVAFSSDIAHAKVYPRELVQGIQQ